MNGYRLDLPSTSDLLRLFGDPSRVRLLALLAEEELTVAELVRITRISQSRVSSHLGRLKDAGVLADRPEGASTWYRLDEEALPPSARAVWDLVRESTCDPLLDEDRRQLTEVLARRNGSQSWADAVAGEMERHYSPGRTWEATAFGLLGLARLGDVLDVASGDGAIAALLAPRARSVSCIDRSARVCAAGARRLRHLQHVRYQRGDMHALPYRAASFDQVLLLNALTYAADPAAVLAEAHRVLRPGGQLVGVTLHRHGHEDVVRRYGHLALGFEPGQVEHLLQRQGFHVELCRVTSRERRRPHFEVITIHARRGPGAAP